MLLTSIDRALAGMPSCSNIAQSLEGYGVPGGGHDARLPEPLERGVAIDLRLSPRAIRRHENLVAAPHRLQRRKSQTDVSLDPAEQELLAPGVLDRLGEARIVEIL